MLHHQPPNIGLNLDEGGWADVDELLTALPLAGAEWHKSSARAPGAVSATISASASSAAKNKAVKTREIDRVKH